MSLNDTTAATAAITIVDADQFHPLRGHVAEGVIVRFSHGATRRVTNTMTGWTLTDGDGKHLFNPLPSADGFAAMIDHFDRCVGVPEGRDVDDGLDVLGSPSLPQEPLTEREHAVLTAVAAGLTLPEIAQNLQVSRFTMADYVKQVYRKLGVSSRAEAVQKAQQLGLLTQRC